MICPKCGAALDGDAKFCVSCGCQIGWSEASASEEVVTPVTSQEPVEKTMPESNSHKKADTEKEPSKFNIGTVVGTLLIIVGLSRIMTADTSISPTSFGGDFYTYTYQGIVVLSEILVSIEVSLGWVIVAIGAAVDVHSWRSGRGQ